MHDSVHVRTGPQDLRVDGQFRGNRPLSQVRTATVEIDLADVLVEREEKALFARTSATHEHGVVADTHAHMAENVLGQAGVRQNATRQGERSSQRSPSQIWTIGMIIVVVSPQVVKSDHQPPYREPASRHVAR